MRYEDRLWRVGLVNASRARLDPVQGTIHKLLTAQFMTYGQSVNISPTSPLETVPEYRLSDEQRRRAERLAPRTEDSFIVVDASVFEKEPEMSADAAVVGQPTAAKAKPAKPAPTSTVAQPTVSANKQANKERLEKLKAKAAEKNAAKAAKPPKEKTVRPCACGCGEQVSAYFAQGHDARFKGWMVKVERGQMAVKDLPPMVQKSYEFKKKPGSDGGYVTTKNYKGEPHKGYDKTAAA